MASFTITPKVDETQEFLEIANDFSNPLELVREALSNAFDAKAMAMSVRFSVQKEEGEPVLQIDVEDDGEGMDAAGLQSFFDLGNSLRRGDPESIGEKGHGTKVYFNSARIEVVTTRDDRSYHAILLAPFRKLFNRESLHVQVEETNPASAKNGTKIKVVGYNNNRRELFTHERLKDYVQWFTKFGSIGNVARDSGPCPCYLGVEGFRSAFSREVDIRSLFPGRKQEHATVV